MAQWEEEVLYQNKSSQLVMFKRFINDVIVLWAGDEDNLIQFCQYLNNNEKYIALSWKIYDKKINSLDLEISCEDRRLKTKTGSQK